MSSSTDTLIFSQLSRSYVSAVNSAEKDGKRNLMRLLPSLLKSSTRNCSIQQQFDE
ncbi:hypothetical protein GCK32_011498, partial [Trichostrongylus colubriformis]